MRQIREDAGLHGDENADKGATNGKGKDGFWTSLSQPYRCGYFPDATVIPPCLAGETGENGEEAVQEEAKSAINRINDQLAREDLLVGLSELRSDIDELKRLHSENTDVLPFLDYDLITRAEDTYTRAESKQSEAKCRFAEVLGKYELQHVRNDFAGDATRFQAIIADARLLGLDAERIRAAEILKRRAEDSARVLRVKVLRDQFSSPDSGSASAFLTKVCEVLLACGLKTMQELRCLGSDSGGHKRIQLLQDKLKQRFHSDDDAFDVMTRLERLISLCWLPPGVNADESIKLLRGCDRNYENEEDGLKLSAMELLKHRFFEVAKAAHVTDKSSLDAAEAANDPVANDPGYLFIKACFEQLQPPREPDVTIAEHQVTIAKHHNMLRLVGPSKSGKSELAKLLARLYVASVDKPEDRLEGRWLEMDQILPDTSERSVWVAEVLGQPIKIWGPLKYLWHLAKKKPEARFALIMPEANRGDLFNILNRHWFEPRNRLGVSSSALPDAAPPANLCIIFTENPVTANGAYQVMGGDEALGTRLTRDQTAAVEHGRVNIDGEPVGKVEDGLCNPKLRFDMSNFAQFFVRNHHVDAADANDLAWLASTSEWKSTFDSAHPATTMPDFFERTSKLHVGDQHRIADKLCRDLKRKRKREEEQEAEAEAEAKRPKREMTESKRVIEQQEDEEARARSLAATSSSPSANHPVYPTEARGSSMAASSSGAGGGGGADGGDSGGGEEEEEGRRVAARPH